MAEPQRKTITVPENAEAKKLKQAFDAVLHTEDGQLVWAYLHRVLGWNTRSLHLSRVTGDIAPLSTEAAAALRDTYLEMRHIPERKLVLAAEELAEAPPAKPKSEPTPKEK